MLSKNQVFLGQLTRTNSSLLCCDVLYVIQHSLNQNMNFLGGVGLTEEMSRQLAQGARILGLTANDTVFKEGSSMPTSSC